MRGGTIKFKRFIDIIKKWNDDPEYYKNLYWSVSVNDMPVQLNPPHFDDSVSLITAVTNHLEKRGLKPDLGKLDYFNIMVVGD